MDMCVAFSEIAIAFLLAGAVSLFALILAPVVVIFNDKELSSKATQTLWWVVAVGLAIGVLLAFILYFGTHRWFVPCPN